MINAAQKDNLSKLHTLISGIPDDMYSHTQWGDNLNYEAIVASSPTSWTGPACALGHAYRSGIFPELQNPVIENHEAVFGGAATLCLFIMDNGIAEGAEGRRMILDRITNLITPHEYA